MIRILNDLPGTETVVRYTDYTLDGASKSLYFYRALEMDDKFKFSESSLPVGPVLMVNAFPPDKPQIRKIITKLQNTISNTPSSVLFEINEYSENQKISKVEITLAPLSGTEAGLKVAIFPLSPSKAIIVESRRVTQFSCTTATPRDGVLAYILDLSLGHGQDFLFPLESNNKKDVEESFCSGIRKGPSPNQLLYEGDSVTYEGMTVEVLKSSNFDRVVITRKP